MSAEIAFVGDIHGNLSALRGLCEALAARGGPHAIFLGDYINKGAQSAEVMEELLAYSGSGYATLLRGNHESALLDALDNEDLTAFLKMGGAMTIRSYVGTKVGPDVLSEFRARFPSEHLGGIRRMPETYESNDFIAQHTPPSAVTRKFRVSAHVPVGKLPRIGPNSAQLDTGCGFDYGRLTALLWPSLDYVQVDAHGAIVTS
ncbi:serine/threonine protein phosphatase [Microtetraspora sp. NBRC 13810]|uniref:metallophosphoesterase n=1 Tax=Microtetraspora sp. NBRC 13810 TaxID=3030990 RepID=UPI0025549C2D|nr:metallophosphoesterase [Microtetraspora sp. NBRC 13810]GLW10095.1 serine/threonine protein phosphatase [Microtetraspora sp. NBRC 13810]